MNFEISTASSSFSLSCQWYKRKQSKRPKEFVSLERKLKKQCEKVIPHFEHFVHVEKGLILHKQRRKKISVGLLLCGDHKIRRLNRIYRQKDKVTDVLSFPLYDSFRIENEGKLTFSSDDIELGDIVIDVNQAARQAKQYQLSLDQEFWHLFTHGVLHLLGYDHELSNREAKLMFSLEEKLVNKIFKTLYDC